MLRVIALVSALASLTRCSNNTSAPTATVHNGTYLGVYSAEYDQEYFLGIPYAQSPTGSLRFRNPLSLNESWDGPRAATQYSGEVCSQYSSFFAVIDCPNSAMDMAQISGTMLYPRTAYMPM